MEVASAATGRGEYNRQSVVTRTMQKELRLKMLREEGKRQKEEDIAQLEETVRTLKEQNEKERVAVLELESALSKQKRRVEKQRRWAETQSSYRLCLERMIRDTMHQSISYKEQARLNQAACNALMACLDCQKLTCEAAEKDLLQRYSQREGLAALIQPNAEQSVQKKPVRGRDIVDVSSCLSLVTTSDGQVVTPEKGLPQGDASEQCSENENENGDGDDGPSLQREHRRSNEVVPTENGNLFQENVPKSEGKDVLHNEGRAPAELEKRLVPPKDSESELQSGARKVLTAKRDKEGRRERIEKSNHEELHESHKASRSRMKSVEVNSRVVENTETKPQKGYGKEKTEDNDLDVLARHEFASQGSASPIVESTPLSKAFSNRKEQNFVTLESEITVSEGRIDGDSAVKELMPEVVATHVTRSKSAEAAAGEPTALDDERVRKMGKSNIDKWLHVLLDEEGSPRISTEVSPPSGSLDHGQPPLSPGLSNLSMAALRGSIELDEGRDHEFPKEGAEKHKGRWSGLIRKRGSRQMDEDCDDGSSPRTDTRHNLRNALKSFEDFKMNDEDLEGDAEHDCSSVVSATSIIPESVRNWPEGGIKAKGGVNWYQDTAVVTRRSQHSKSLKEHPVTIVMPNIHKRSVSEDDEGLKSQILNIGSRGHSQVTEYGDGLGLQHKHGLRASIKACTLKWRTAARKPLQEGGIPLPP